LKREINDLFERYERNELNAAELQVLEDWFKSLEEKNKSPLLQDGVKKINLESSIWDHIAGATYLQTKTVEQKKKSRFSLLQLKPALLGKIAAGLALFIFFSWQVYVWINPSPSVVTAMTMVSTPQNGMVKKVVLPDGSEIWINAKSTIHFPKQFSPTLREVYLDEGEAFFEVKKDKTKPFIVHAGKLKTTVLGTSFSIKYYASIKSTRVLVRTGKVGVSLNGTLLSYLTPKEGIVLDRISGDYEKITSDIAANGWINGLIEFENASFEEVALALTQNYGVSLHYKPGTATTAYSYTLQLNTKKTLEDNLSIICKMHNLNYRRIKNEIELY